MTNHVHAHARAGSSLFQARNTHHDHRHLHSLQQRYQDQKRDSGSAHHIRSSQPQHENIENRQIPADVDPVVVVQTISVVQVIDGSGAIVEISTIFSDSIAVETPVIPAAETVNVGVGVAVSASLSLSADLATPSTSPSATVSDGSPSAATTAETVHVTNSSSSSTSNEATLTSAPLPSSTDGLSLPASFNSTTSRQPSLFSNSTLFRTLFTNSTTSSSNLFPSATDDLASSATLDGSVSVEVVTVVATVTPDAGGSGDGVAPSNASPSASTVPATSTGLPKETQNAVIGSVVGVAGMALIVLLAMIILRWKRQQGGGPTRLRDRSSSVTGRALPAPGGGGNDGGVGAMAERSAPFSIPSALAVLTNQKRRSGASHTAGAPSGEKGFYRVSGKKLTPVILSGGDGFSDPHDSMRTDVSFYRDSQGFFPGSGALQLGSPMRPESGVPIMRSGPGRTPVQEQNPFSDHAHPLTPPPLTPPARDPLGRSLISQDGSRGSGSRFTEEI